MSFHYYKVHHWIVASVVLLPELPSVEPQRADVFITAGKVPEQLPDQEVIKKGELWEGTLKYEVGKGTLLLVLKDTGRFLIGSDSSILIDKLEDTDEASIRLYLLGTCFGFLLIKQSIFPFHGSTLLTPFGAVMFIGQSGWGKSTTAAKFIQEGHKLLTDDVCVVRTLDKGTPYAYPSSFRIKLWEDSVSELCFDTDVLHDIVPNFTKKQFYADTKLCQAAQPLKAIYALWPDEADVLRIEPLKSNEKLAVLAQNTFRLEAVGILGLHREHFDFCGTIARSVPVRRLWRPVSTFSIDNLYREVMNDLANIHSTALSHAKA
jgi:hypothetical protein